MFLIRQALLLSAVLLLLTVPSLTQSVNLLNSDSAQRRDQVAGILDSTNRYEAWRFRNILDDAHAIIQAHKEAPSDKTNEHFLGDREDSHSEGKGRNSIHSRRKVLEGHPFSAKRSNQRRHKLLTGKKSLKSQLLDTQADLNKCQAALETCTPTSNATSNDTGGDPGALFVQMAGACTIERVDSKYSLIASDLDVHTYIFRRTPWEYLDSVSTDFYFTYLFDQIYNGSTPDGAVTFRVSHEEAAVEFQGPIVAVMMANADYSVDADNLTLYKYDLVQNPKQQSLFPLSNFFPALDENVTASITFQECSIMIDPSSIGSDTSLDLFTARTEWSQSIARVDRAADNLAKAPSPSKFWANQGTKAGGLEAKDAIRGGAEIIRTTADLLSSCTGSAGCDASKIVNGVSNIILSGAFIIGAAFPPAGIALALIGSIGLLLTSLFGPKSEQLLSKIPPISIYDMQEAVDRALAAFTANLDQDTLKAVETFASIDLRQFIHFVGQLEYIKVQKKDQAQTFINQQVERWYTQVWNPSWTGIYLKSLLDLERQYQTWFGDNASGLRSRLKAYAQTCDASCTLTKDTSWLISDGNKRLKECQDSVKQNQDRWNQLLAYAHSYLLAATRLFQMSSLAVSILQYYEGCDIDKYENPSDISYTYECKYYAAMNEISTKVFQVQGRSFFLQNAMKNITRSCNPDGYRWPFSQVCRQGDKGWINSKCNYPYVVALYSFAWRNNLGSTNEEGKFVVLDESYYLSNARISCENVLKWNSINGLGRQGLFYYSYWSVFGQGTSCNEILNSIGKDDRYYIYLGAIPSFCIPQEQCKKIILDDDAWGIRPPPSLSF